MHQDAHEFLNHLLNMIVEEMENEKRSAQNNPPGDDRELSKVDVSYQFIIHIFEQLATQ